MHFDSEAENCRLREIRTGSEEIFDGVVLHVQRDTVKLPNGSEAVREVIRHIGAVCVIPVMENGDGVMERQFR
jgi:ADP-ribose pyrophosphatase